MKLSSVRIPALLAALGLATGSARAAGYSLEDFRVGAVPAQLVGEPFTVGGWTDLPAEAELVGGGYSARLAIVVSPVVAETPVPALAVQLTDSGIRLHWVPDDTGLVLEARAELAGAGEWQTVPGDLAGGEVFLAAGTGPQFFRLRRRCGACP